MKVRTRHHRQEPSPTTQLSNKELRVDYAQFASRMQELDQEFLRQSKELKAIARRLSKRLKKR